MNQDFIDTLREALGHDFLAGFDELVQTRRAELEEAKQMLARRQNADGEVLIPFDIVCEMMDDIQASIEREGRELMEEALRFILNQDHEID